LKVGSYNPIFRDYRTREYYEKRGRDCLAGERREEYGQRKVENMRGIHRARKPSTTISKGV